MSILDRARKDAQRFVSDAKGFATSITFKHKEVIVSVNGTAKRHYTSYDDMGNVVGSINASCTVAEINLINQGYPVRNNLNEVYLRGHKVEWKDAMGALYSYTIQSWFPDEHLGLLVLTLGH